MPVKIKVQTDKLAAFGGKIDRLPLILKAEGSDGKLNLTADVALPLTRRDLDFKMSFTGKKMSDLIITRTFRAGICEPLADVRIVINSLPGFLGSLNAPL